MNVDIQTEVDLVECLEQRGGFCSDRYYDAKDGWLSAIREPKEDNRNVKVCFLTASELYYEENREFAHCALNEDLFLQKPISTNDLLKEVNRKIYST